MPAMRTSRNLVIVLGDQLDLEASAFDGFDPSHDIAWMAEVAQESTHVPSSKQRIAVFLSAMRHFAVALQHKKIRVDYTTLDDPKNTGTLAGELSRAIQRHTPSALIMTAPGDWRVLDELRKTANEHRLSLEIREDRHFFSTVREFAAHAKTRKQLRLEYWYRELRQQHNILMHDGKPEGGAWNFDEDNRESFGKQGPPDIPSPVRFAPDTITQDVIALVNKRFAGHPGAVSDTMTDTCSFGWPVTRQQAVQCLHTFIEQRLALFGRYQDAMWQGQAWLFHSHLSAALNLKLLNPREVVQAAEQAYRMGKAPLAAAEGFIRQILGWREYVRGIYWLYMPQYREQNALGALQPLPEFFWSGETDMNCLRDTIRQTLSQGYAHHIQRLMVTGLYALLYGVKPTRVHEWYLSVYVDAVEWVELPNTLGMSQFADGGLMASKPYAASGKYIDRMSNYCKTCRYDPAKSVDDSKGKPACPFTTLYWDFLIRHEAMLAKNPRMAMQVRNLSRLSGTARQAIQRQANAHRKSQSLE
jgi:deoxyribodipyrimidine photolyase-related protein